MGFLALIFWIIGLYFGFRLLFAASTHLGMDSSQYLRVWMGIFVLVTLQMSTALRPLIGTAPTTLPTQKKFFLERTPPFNPDHAIERQLRAARPVSVRD